MTLQRVHITGYFSLGKESIKGPGPASRKARTFKVGRVCVILFHYCKVVGDTVIRSAGTLGFLPPSEAGEAIASTTIRALRGHSTLPFIKQSL